MLQQLLGYLFNNNLQAALIFLAVFLVLYNYTRKQCWRGLPPGPPCLPLLGSLPFLGSTDLRVAAKHLRQKYGDVCTVYLGQTRTVFLSHYDVIREALITKGNVFNARPSTFLVDKLCRRSGIMNSDGDFWKEQRRFSLEVLREFGLGKSILEDKIRQELWFMKEEIDQMCGQPTNPHHIFSYAICNVIGSLVSGNRREYHNPDFIEHMKELDESMEVAANAQAYLTAFPMLEHLPVDLVNMKAMWDMNRRLIKRYEDMLEGNKRTYDLSSEPECLTDAYLRALAERKGDSKTTFSEMQLVFLIGELYVAGTETTSSTLRWALVYLLNYPDVLKRVQQEIDEVLGPQQEPSMRHKLQMPYTEATLLEVQRLGDIAPFAVPHATSEDVELRGYHIPKGTMILPNLNSVHRDERHFPDPLKFDPNRFLDEHGNVKKNETLVPFSLGRRLCLGEGLAKMELFMFFTFLLQHFTPSVPEGQKPPSFTSKLGITASPLHFNVVFTNRT